jgi:hypothetical protein
VKNRIDNAQLHASIVKKDSLAVVVPVKTRLRLIKGKGV